MPGLLAVGRDEQPERDHEEVSAATGWVEDADRAHRVRSLQDGVLGDRLGHVVLPVLLQLAVDRHQGVEGDLAGIAPLPPFGATRVEPRQDRLRVGRPAVLPAHRQPGEAEAVLEQPLDHVALGEHLRLRRDLVGLDLAAAADLGVERLAVGVVPVLVVDRRAGNGWQTDRALRRAWARWRLRSCPGAPRRSAAAPRAPGRHPTAQNHGASGRVSAPLPLPRSVC